MINAEVRLYYKGRQSWDTEFFMATSETDLLNKAKKLAKRHGADHFNCGVATPEEEQRHDVVSRRPSMRVVTSNLKDQVESIEQTMGLGRKER